MEDLEARWAGAMVSVDADAVIAVGCDLAEAGRQEAAEACFRRAVALGEEWAWFNVGNALGEQGRAREAVAAFELALAAGETDAWRNLGYVLEDLGDLAGAMRAHRRAGEAGDAEGYLQLGHLLRKQGERTEAEQVVALAADAGHAEAAAVLACWEFDRTFDPALEPRLRAGAEHYGSARVDLAHLLRDTGRTGEALVQLERGAKLGQVECWLPLGNLLADVVSDEAAAKDAYRAGIGAGDLHCHHNLATLLEAQGRTAEAEDQFAAGAAGGDALAAQALRRLRGETGE